MSAYQFSQCSSQEQLDSATPESNIFYYFLDDQQIFWKISNEIYGSTEKKLINIDQLEQEKRNKAVYDSVFKNQKKLISSYFNRLLIGALLFATMLLAAGIVGGLLASSPIGWIIAIPAFIIGIGLIIGIYNYYKQKNLVKLFETIELPSKTVIKQNIEILDSNNSLNPTIVIEAQKQAFNHKALRQAVAKVDWQEPLKIFVANHKLKTKIQIVSFLMDNYEIKAGSWLIDSFNWSYEQVISTFFNNLNEDSDVKHLSNYLTCKWDSYSEQAIIYAMKLQAKIPNREFIRFNNSLVQMLGKDFHSAEKILSKIDEFKEYTKNYKHKEIEVLLSIFKKLSALKQVHKNNKTVLDSYYKSSMIKEAANARLQQEREDFSALISSYGVFAVSIQRVEELYPNKEAQAQMYKKCSALGITIFDARNEETLRAIYPKQFSTNSH
ncbi:MAG: hypothetical protein H0U70_03070 [Tatlockia sp.]|nr:hypothetical protein [Tatlockia sp.]